MSCSRLPIQNRKCEFADTLYYDATITKIITFFPLLLCSSCLCGVPRMPTQPRDISLWEMVRLVNMLIVFRFLRIIPEIKVSSTVLMNDLYYDRANFYNPPHAHATVTSQAWIEHCCSKIFTVDFLLFTDD